MNWFKKSVKMLTVAFVDGHLCGCYFIKTPCTFVSLKYFILNWREEKHYNQKEQQSSENWTVNKDRKYMLKLDNKRNLENVTF